MVLYMIGLGLGNEQDITVKGLQIVQNADLVFLEAYTSVLGVDRERLENFYSQGLDDKRIQITVADRDMIEQQVEEQILTPALQGKNVVLLVVGDPVCATTHTDLWLRARHMGIHVEIIHNASIMGAAGACGLQLYNFGHTVSIPFFEDNWQPVSFYPKIQYNRAGGMHTLCLLDIKVKEPDFNAMMRGQTKYLPPRFMSIATAAQQLITVEEVLVKQQAYHVDKTLCVGLARMGQETQCIRAGTLRELADYDFGGPLHSLVICGHLHDLEVEVLKEFLIEGSRYNPQDHLVAPINITPIQNVEPENDSIDT